jgi:hypothetical protein
MPTLRMVSVNDVYSLEALARLATLIRRQREGVDLGGFDAIDADKDDRVTRVVDIDADRVITRDDEKNSRRK